MRPLRVTSHDIPRIFHEHIPWLSYHLSSHEKSLCRIALDDPGCGQAYVQNHMLLGLDSSLDCWSLGQLTFFDGSRIGGFHTWRAIEWIVCNGKSYEHGWFGRSPILGNLLWAKKRNTGQLAVITNKNHELVSVIPRDGGFSVPYLKSREASKISCKASWCISLATLMVFDGTTY